MGINSGRKAPFLENPLKRTSFRTSWTVPEGAGGALIHEARIVNINLPNWTVDTITIFDRLRFFDIQVASPYMHANTGEGIYAVPEIGAKCVICVPSDGPPPFVLAYIMPPETLPFTDQEIENPEEAFALRKGSTYSGGRKRPKPGDIVLQGRDGNFVILHRGGILQFGSTELSQRICIPMGNLITDISQNYNHFNSGGAINWGVVQSSPEDNPETEYKHVFRLFSNSKYADIRASLGKVSSVVPEPAGDDGETSNMSQLGIADPEPVVFEFVLSPGGFDGSTGALNEDTRDATKLKILFDKGGNGMFRAEGSVDLRIKKKFKLTVDEDIEIVGKKSIKIGCEDTMDIVGGKSLNIRTNDGVLSLNGGTKPVATVGSMVNVTLPIPLQIMTSTGPGTIIAGQVLTGQVSTGNPTIKV